MPFTFDHVIDNQRYLTKLRVDYWLSNSLFSVQWFCLLALLLISWAIAIKLIDKKNVTDVILSGLLMLLTLDFLDQIGILSSLWDYQIQLIPIPTGLIAVNYSLVPVLTMLMYQYYPDWRRFLLYSTLLSFVGSAIIEPLLEVFKIYTVINWEHYYSFPIYIAIAAIDKMIVDSLVRLRSRTR